MAHDWVEIDGQVLVDARNRKGLSREALGAVVGVVAKTVERYENQGRVPRALLPRFATTLDLDIQELPPTVVKVAAGESEDGRVDALQRGLAEVRGEVAGLTRAVEDLAAEIAAQRRPPEAHQGPAS